MSSSKACFIYPEYQGDPKDYLNENNHIWFASVNNIPRTESFFVFSVMRIFSELRCLKRWMITWHGTAAVKT